MSTGALLPIGWGTTVGLTSGPALPSNPSRTALVFVNASSGVSIAIIPAVVNQGTLGVYPGTSLGVAVINGQGSITMAPGDKFVIDTLACTCAWNAIASGAGGLLSVLES